MEKRNFTKKIASDAERAQRVFCREHSLPFFAPEGGRCPRCGRDVYEGADGAGEAQVTGCPHCHATFCD